MSEQFDYYTENRQVVSDKLLVVVKYLNEISDTPLEAEVLLSELVYIAMRMDDGGSQLYYNMARQELDNE